MSAAPQVKGDVADTDQVLVEEKGSTRILTLNRPKQLNALSSQMILNMLKLFTAYEEDRKVKLLIVKVSHTHTHASLPACPPARLHPCAAMTSVIRLMTFHGKGRAFSAGGDVAAVAHSINEGHWTSGANFFWNEFILDYIIATYRKPQVSVLNGIVMGGGAGACIHGKFRVATENTVFAMPETALGLFPDIGASYFLSRLPGYFGEYVGLTGARLDGSEMHACGLATHFVPSTKLELLEELLIQANSSDPFTICGVIDQFSQKMPLEESSSYNRLDIIDRCFSKRTVEEILYALEQEAVNVHDKWISAAIESLKKASPTSHKISLRSIREGRNELANASS